MTNMIHDDEALRILCMDMAPEGGDGTDSYYRVKAGRQVKYLTIAPDTLDPDDYCLPLYRLTSVRFDDESWTKARISRNEQSGKLDVDYSNEELPGIETIWHPKQIDVLSLPRIKKLTTNPFETRLPADMLDADLASLSHRQMSAQPIDVVAKIAHFDWEIPRLEQETWAYHLLYEKSVNELAPRFLGHIHENGRVIGFALEKVSNCTRASIEHLDQCAAVLKRLHAIDLLHGDVCRYNFLVRPGSVLLIDFEHSQIGAPEEIKAKEIERLNEELIDESGRGAGFVPVED